MPSQMSLPLNASWEKIWASAAQENGVAGEAHLFLEILESEDDIVAMLLALSGVSREEARLYARSWLEESSPGVEKKTGYARDVIQVLLLASREAEIDKKPFIEPHHFFIACVSHRRGPHLGEVLRPLGLDAARLRQHLRGIRASERPYPRGNPLNDLTQGAKESVEAAHAEMRASYCGRIATTHLLLGLLSDAEVSDILERAGCEVEDLRKRARESIQSDGEIASPQKKFSPGAKRALERAAREAKQAGRKTIDCGHLLLGLLPQNETRGEKWKARGQTLDSLDFLWNAAQIKALRLFLRGESVAKLSGAVAISDSPHKSPWMFAYCSFLISSMCGGALSSAPLGSPLFVIFFWIGLGVPIVLGTRTLAVRLLNRSPEIQNAWLGFFGGWLLGFLFGAFLLTRI